jgi:prepilin-type N-terminal cleavage/methylation domain-containing protein
VTRLASRRGYTLIELIAVMAILILIAAVVLPSVAGFRGDSRPRAAADAIRGELAASRARAKEEGRPYRVALSQDGKRLRRAPDDDAFASAAAADSPGGAHAAVDYALEGVTASVAPEQDSQPPGPDGDGWVTLASAQPDGTLRLTTGTDSVLVSVKEEGGGGALYVRVRGLTGRVSVVANPSANGGAK